MAMGCSCKLALKMMASLQTAAKQLCICNGWLKLAIGLLRVRQSPILSVIDAKGRAWEGKGYKSNGDAILKVTPLEPLPARIFSGMNPLEVNLAPSNSSYTQPDRCVSTHHPGDLHTRCEYEVLNLSTALSGLRGSQVRFSRKISISLPAIVNFSHKIMILS